MDLEPIGKIHRLSENESMLEIHPSYTEGLHGIMAGERVQVLYWMHELKPGARQMLEVHPRGDRHLPLKGVFGLRSPMRPNPIGVSVVRVARLEENQVLVTGLDALDGSPVIDIKAASGLAECGRLIDIWGKIHNAVVSHLEKEFGEDRLRRVLRKPLWEAGRRAAEGRREDAPAIGRKIMGLEQVRHIRGRVLKERPDRFVREVAHCPWSYFRPLSCRLFEWWMEGLCEGLNSSFRFTFEKLIPEGDKTCVWAIFRQNVP